MKACTKFKGLLVAFLLLSILPVTVHAGDYTYTTNSDNTITITGYIGTDGVVNIPDVIDGLPIAIIGDNAFFNRTNLTNIIIPDSVISIGGWAFYSCSSLTNAILGTNVTSIGDSAFQECYSLTDITIPSSVTSIGSGTFGSCYRLTAITVDEGNSVYSSFDGVLFNKPKTTLIQYPAVKAGAYTIPNSVTSIGGSAFNSCYSLTSVTIGSGVTSIGSGAFYYCVNLTSVTIPASVTNIGESVFLGCSSLSAIAVNPSNSVYSSLGGVLLNKNQATLILCPGGKNGSYIIPSIVKIIGDNAFMDCRGLTSVTIGSGITSIGYGAFYGCSGLTDITIPNGVSSIGGAAFLGCSSLSSVIIPNSVTGAVDAVFWNCTSLTSATIPNSVTDIGSYTFYNCTSLKNVMIGGGITNVEYSTFENCPDLTSIYFWGNAPHFGWNVFEGDTNAVVYYLADTTGWTNVWAGRPTALFPYTYTIENDTVTITKYTGLGRAYIPDTIEGLPVTSIGARALAGCSSLTEVEIPDSVTYIGADAFYDCRNLTSVTIGKGVTSIGSGAFDSCVRLNNIVIPDSVTALGEWAFYDCRNLTSVTIGKGVTSIGYGAFDSCVRLTEVYFRGNAPVLDEYVFFGDTLTTVYYLSGTTGWTNPWGTLAAYSWSPDFTYTTNNSTITLTGYTGTNDSVTIPERINGLPVTSIEDWAFSGISLTSVTIPSNVTSIGDLAFSYCIGLTTAVIGNGVTNIGNMVFFQCTSLTSITVNVTNSFYSSLEGILFDKNQTTLIQYPGGKLGSYTIPGSVTSIGTSAFQSCTNLFSITIPNSVTSIGDWAFYYCVNLTSVTIPNSVNSIGGGAFGGTSLTSVTIPNSVNSIGGGAFGGCPDLSEFTVDEGNSVYSSLDGVWFDKPKATLIQYPQGKTGKSYTIPNSVTSIGEVAFDGCTNLTSVTIPASVISIGFGSFSCCSSLTSVTIPNSVTSIGDWAFSSCTNLTSVTIPNSVTSINGCAFYGCSSLTSITIPNSVTSIGREAFYNCSSLTSVTIPNSVTSIGNGAFGSCVGLTNAVIGNGVTNIGEGGFVFCTNLTGAYFHGNAPILAEYVFYDDSKATVYRTAEATGFTNPWGGLPTALWKPDSDADGIPDSWATLYFDGPTNAIPNEICANGINTVREAYIAGLDPTDPQSTLQTSAPSDGKVLGWNAVSGRVYSVYWTTNLMNGFQCLESNIPWTQASFTNSADVPCGYYKINVQLE